MTAAYTYYRDLKGSKEKANFEVTVVATDEEAAERKVRALTNIPLKDLHLARVIDTERLINRSIVTSKVDVDMGEQYD